MRRLAAAAVLLVYLVCAAGCSGITISRGGTRGLLPEIPAPARPVLQELTPDETVEAGKIAPALKTKIQANQLELQKYIKKFEVSVEEYNAYVRVNNKLARAELGLGEKATGAGAGTEGKEP